MEIKTLRKETGFPFLLLKKIVDEYKKSNSRNVDRLFRKYMQEYSNQFKDRETRFSTYGYHYLYSSYVVVEILSETNSRELINILSDFATSTARKIIFNGYTPDLEKEFCELRCRFGENIQLGKISTIEKSFSQKIFGFYKPKKNSDKLCAVIIETQEATFQSSYLEVIAELIAKNAVFYYGEYLEARKDVSNLDFIKFLRNKHLLFCDDYVKIPSLAKSITIGQHLDVCSNILYNNECHGHNEMRNGRFANKKLNRITIKKIEVFGVE